MDIQSIPLTRRLSSPCRGDAECCTHSARLIVDFCEVSSKRANERTEPVGLRWGTTPRYFSVAILFTALSLLPRTTSAETLAEIINNNIIPIFNSLVGLIMVLALLGFIAGVIRFMYTAGDDKSRSDGKTLMVWGTVALFLMISIWGIVAVVRDSFFK